MKPHLSIVILSLLCLFFSACDDSDDCCNEQSNWICVSVEDQFGDQMNCDYDYSFGPNADGFEGHPQCEDGQLLIVGFAGSYRVNAECGDLKGRVTVPLEPYNPDWPSDKLYTSRLVGSLCYNDLYDDGRPIILDPGHQKVSLGDYLGYSTDTRCENFFGYAETYWTEIKKVTLVCPEDAEDCDPADGRKYLILKGEFGIISDGWPTCLNVEMAPNMVPAGQEVTLLVTLREMKGAEQEIDLPIVIRGPEVL